MKVIYQDGGVLKCSYINVYLTMLVIDDIYFVPISEIKSIEEE